MKTIKYYSPIFIQKRRPLNLSEINIYLMLEFKIYAFWESPHWGRWSLVINLSPSGLIMPNTELGCGRIIFIKLVLKILKLDVQILKLSLFHSFIVHGKKEYLNASVLQEYVVIFLVFRVLYKWDSEGINSAK